MQSSPYHSITMTITDCSFFQSPKLTASHIKLFKESKR